MGLNAKKHIKMQADCVKYLAKQRAEGFNPIPLSIWEEVWDFSTDADDDIKDQTKGKQFKEDIE